MRLKWVLILLATGALAACGGGSPKLHKLSRVGQSPDEFRIVPAKPLQMPSDLKALPAPVPNGTNLADIDPIAEAVSVLGGNPAVLKRGGIPVSDRALLRYADRYGVPPGIRDTLAAEDEALRQRATHGVLSGWLGGDRYYRLYKRWALEPFGELARLRAAGVKTPSAPPPPGG